MPLQGKAIRAEGVVPGLEPPIWQEFSILCHAYRALDPVTKVKQPDDAGEEMADLVQVPAGDESRNQTNDRFHDAKVVGNWKLKVGNWKFLFSDQ
jgi:hypothetical protein